jgi:hypothetical protein
VAPQSEIVREFTAGEAVVIAVDGKSGSSGDAILSVEKVTCPGIDLDLQPLPLSSTTLDGSNLHSGACGGDALREKAFRYEAAVAGLYQFSVSSDEFTPALYVESGARCGGELLGCNTGAISSAATVVRRLAQGEVVTLIVDGAVGAGAFSLDVQDLAPAECPALAPLDPLNAPVVGTLTPGDPSIMTGSCAPARQTVSPGGSFALPEHTYAVTTAEGSGCDLSIVTDAPVAVYVLEGLLCGGRELGCEPVEPTAEDDVHFLQFDLGDAFDGLSHDYVVVVESTNPVFGTANYSLFEGCFTP